MPEKPEDPYLTDEPRTLESHGLDAEMRQEQVDERPPLRRIAFWVVVALVVAAGLVLYFQYTDAVFPVLRTDR